MLFIQFEMRILTSEARALLRQTLLAWHKAKRPSCGRQTYHRCIALYCMEFYDCKYVCSNPPKSAYVQKNFPCLSAGTLKSSKNVLIAKASSRSKAGDIVTMGTAPLSAVLPYQSAVIRDPEQPGSLQLVEKYLKISIQNPKREREREKKKKNNYGEYVGKTYINIFKT